MTDDKEKRIRRGPSQHAITPPNILVGVTTMPMLDRSYSYSNIKALYEYECTPN
jgi:hypothetical protein